LQVVQFLGVRSEETGLAGLKLSQTKKPLYITATDLNSGGEIVFGSPRAKSRGSHHHILKSKSRYQPLLYPKDILITKALRASIGLPVLFKPYPMKIGPRKLALLDGGIRDNCPFTLAACLPGVSRILASVLSYAGQQNIDYYRKDMASVFFDFLEISTSFAQLGRACQDNIFVKKDHLSLRIVNPGLFSINPLDIKKSQLMMISAYNTMQSIFNKFDNINDFWHKWNSDQINGFSPSRWKVEKLGLSKSNIVSISDLKSPLERKLKSKGLKKILKKIFS